MGAAHGKRRRRGRAARRGRIPTIGPRENLILEGPPRIGRTDSQLRGDAAPTFARRSLRASGIAQLRRPGRDFRQGAGPHRIRSRNHGGKTRRWQPSPFNGGREQAARPTGLGELTTTCRRKVFRPRSLFLFWARERCAPTPDRETGATSRREKCGKHGLATKRLPGDEAKAELPFRASGPAPRDPRSSTGCVLARIRKTELLATFRRNAPTGRRRVAFRGSWWDKLAARQVCPVCQAEPARRKSCGNRHLAGRGAFLGAGGSVGCVFETRSGQRPTICSAC